MEIYHFYFVIMQDKFGEGDLRVLLYYLTHEVHISTFGQKKGLTVTQVIDKMSVHIWVKMY